MIVSDVITRVRRVFGDEAAVQITDDDIKRWINDAQIEIVKKNQSALLNTTTVNLVANQATYSLASNILLVRAVRYKYSDMQSYKTLDYKSMQQFDESINGWDGTGFPSGYPVLYTQYNNNIIVFPAPDRAATAGLKILYNEVPTDVVNNSDALSLPLIYHNTIQRYCLWQASLLDEDLEPAIMYQQSFDSDLAIVQGRETTEAVASYPVITVREEDL